MPGSADSWSTCSTSRARASTSAEKYADLYPDLQPPLDKDLVIAGGMLHDIGKLRELKSTAAGAEYSAAGELIGHMLQGRDIVREMAAGRDDRPRKAAAARAHHRRPPAAARMGLAEAADDARGADRPLRRRPRREAQHDDPGDRKEATVRSRRGGIRWRRRSIAAAVLVISRRVLAKYRIRSRLKQCASIESRCGVGADGFESFAFGSLGIVQIPAELQVHPEVG